MVLQEMNIDLTCPEDVFQASSPGDFLSAIKQHQSHRRTPLLADSVRNLCSETPSPDVLAYLHEASKLNLFTIATGEKPLYIRRQFLIS